MSQREEDILVQEFERRIAFNKFQVRGENPIFYKFKLNFWTNFLLDLVTSNLWLDICLFPTSILVCLDPPFFLSLLSVAFDKKGFKILLTTKTKWGKTVLLTSKNS